jgi:glycosyltransferase involved in cell wall biosynthesis
MFYSLIIPVYNRPDEIEALLQCLAKQTYRHFEVLIVESGSEIKSDQVVASFANSLNLAYHPTGNYGQGMSRNYGMACAKGDFFIILDSDILLDEDFVSQVDQGIRSQGLDAYGGPDKLHPASTPIQKAVNYSMTSFLTTGGIRGSKKNAGKFYPRSFNMGVSRKVYEATGGYKLPYMGEDIEWSARIMALGFKTGLIEKAHVYHKRKQSLKAYYKQIHWFGRARINIYRYFPATLKPIHFIPLVFLAYLAFAFVNLLWCPWSGVLLFIPVKLFFVAVFIDAMLQYKSLEVAFLSVPAVFIQLYGYAIGMLEEALGKGRKRNDT